MPQTIDIQVPNIGDFHDVPVTDVLVKAGDVVAVDDPLVALESEKATLEIPSPHAGVVASIAVSVGDKVSEGSPILSLEPADAAAAPTPPPSASASGAVSPAQNGATPPTGGKVTLVELRVPDIGEFTDVPVIDVLVSPGQHVETEASLVTLESDKASMDIPATEAGTIVEVNVNVGDKVSQGTLIATLEGAGSARAASSGSAGPASPRAAASEAPTRAPAAEAPSAPATQNGAAPDGGGATTRVELRVPDIGDFADVSVIDVLVSPGQRVDLEAPLVTLESEKASMDIPATAAGTIVEIALKVGDKVSQGTLVATLEVAGAARAPAVAPEAAASPISSPPASAPAAAAPTGEQRASAPQASPSTTTSKGVVHASPSLRRFARELGVELAAVKGSGPHARVTREDVQQFVKGKLAAPPPPRAAAGAGFDVLPWPVVNFEKFGPTERVPLSRIRKLSGPNLHRNWVMIPHVTNNDEADITDLERFRKELNAKDPAAKVTMLAFVMKAVVAALKTYPDVNSSLDGDALVLKKYYNIGFAADTPNGLVVPVLKDADTKGVLAIASETSALAGKARDGKLSAGDMQGASFTISSLGGIGGTTFSPIINAPEVAILGVSRSTVRPMWDGSAFVPRLMLPLSFSYDHRVIDGALAARFNVYLSSVLGDLRRAML